MKPEQFERARRLFDEVMTRETAARAATVQSLAQLDGRPSAVGSGFNRCTGLATLAELDRTVKAGELLEDSVA